MALSTFLISTVIPFVKDEIISTAKDKATSAVKDKVTGTIKNIIFPTDDYAIELNKVILSTIDEYERKFPPSGNFPFYHHKETFATLSKFILFENDTKNILSSINFSELKNIDKPTQEQIEHFYNYFVEQIKANNKLIELFIDENYKDKIFDIYKEISSIKFIIEEFLKNLPDSDSIIKSWIEQIYDNLRKLKSDTALDEINKIENEIHSKHQLSDKNKAFMYFVKGLCLNETHKTEDSVEYFELASSLDPNSLSYKTWSLYLKFLFKKSDEVINEIQELLKVNPFDPLLNGVIHFMNLTEIPSTISSEVPNTVKKNIRFKRLVYLHCLKNHKVDIAIEIFEKDAEDVDALFQNVTLENYGYLDFYMQLYFIKMFRIFPEGNFATINPALRSSNELSKSISYFEKYYSQIENSEKWKLKNLYNYLLNVAKFLKEGNVDYLKTAYSTYQKDKEIISPFYLSVLRIGFVQAKDFVNAMKVFNESQLQAEDYYFKSYVHDQLGEDEASINCIKTFFSEIKKISEENFTLVIDPILSPDITLSDLDEFYKKILSNEISTEAIYRDLIISTKGVKDPSLKEASIEILKNNFNQISLASQRHDVVIGFCRIAYTYNLWDGIVQLFQNIVPTTFIQKSHLIDALYHSKANATKLLDLLEELRLSDTPQFERYYYWEIELNSLLEKWDKVELIAKRGNEHFPNSPSFDYYLALSFTNQGKKAEYVDKVSSLQLAKFQLPNLNAIIQGFIQLEEYSLAIDYCYNYTIANKSAAARGYFFNLFLQYYDKIAMTVPIECEDGYYILVKLEQKTILVNKFDHGNIFTKLIGKKVGEKVGVAGTMTKLESVYEICAIKHKYEVLSDEIRLEAENSELTGLPIKSFQLKENATFEEINQQMIELFGAAGDERNLFIEKNINSYKQNESSLLQISRTIFQDNVFDAYYSLTRSPNIGYRILMKAVFQNTQYAASSKYCLDLLSVFVIFDATKELSLTFNEKFIISSHTIDYLKELLNKHEFNRKSELSLNITTKGVIPKFSDQEEEQNKKQFLIDLINWIETNCEILTSKEKLNFLVHSKDKPEEINNFMCAFIDSACLAIEHNAILISDEKIFLQILLPQKLIMSSELFLSYHTEENQLFKFLSNRNFVGIHIQSSSVNEVATTILNKTGNYENILMNFRVLNGIPSQNIINMLAIIASCLNSESDAEKLKSIISELFESCFEGLYSKPDLLQQVLDLVRISIFQFFMSNIESRKFVTLCLFDVLKKNNVNIELK
jgi:hypothetical protein